MVQGLWSFQGGVAGTFLVPIAVDRKSWLFLKSSLRRLLHRSCSDPCGSGRVFRTLSFLAQAAALSDEDLKQLISQLAQSAEQKFTFMYSSFKTKAKWRARASRISMGMPNRDTAAAINLRHISRAQMQVVVCRVHRGCSALW